MALSNAIRHRLKCWLVEAALLALASCNPQHDLQQESKAPAPRTAPPPSANPHTENALSPVSPPRAAPPFPWNAGQLLEQATFASKTFKGHPEWPLVSAKDGQLVVLANEPKEPDTTIRVPLPKGQYRLSSRLKLRDEAKFAVKFELEVEERTPPPAPVIDWLLIPGDEKSLNKTFRVFGESADLVLTLRMADDAENNWSATVTFSTLKLERM